MQHTAMPTAAAMFAYSGHLPELLAKGLKPPAQDLFFMSLRQVKEMLR